MRSSVVVGCFPGARLSISDFGLRISDWPARPERQRRAPGGPLPPFGFRPSDLLRNSELVIRALRAAPFRAQFRGRHSGDGILMNSGDALLNSPGAFLFLSGHATRTYPFAAWPGRAVERQRINVPAARPR